MAQGDEVTEANGRRMGKLIPILIAAVAALVLGGGAGWYFGMVTAPKTVIVAEEKPRIVDYTIKDRIVNLADQGGRRYLKVRMVLQVAEKKTAKAADGGDGGGDGAGASRPWVPGTPRFVDWEQPGTIVEVVAKDTTAELPNLPQVHDAITTVLTSKRTDELMTFDGRERLRDELMLKLNTVMPTEQQVVKIFFTDFIIQ
ncbi:MAG TPA: flagellar basal body-associated FliL family protein [Chloroflexota bacterium]|nr:flagellar basal body-associated FliL family protein [Chloroflexota bacterium]